MKTETTPNQLYCIVESDPSGENRRLYDVDLDRVHAEQIVKICNKYGRMAARPRRARVFMFQLPGVAELNVPAPPAPKAPPPKKPKLSRRARRHHKLAEQLTALTRGQVRVTHCEGELYFDDEGSKGRLLSASLRRDFKGSDQLHEIPIDTRKGKPREQLIAGLRDVAAVYLKVADKVEARTKKVECRKARRPVAAK